MFWKKKKAEKTFKERVDAFWDVFPERADRFKATIDAGNCGELVNETSEMVKSMYDGFAWVYGPGLAEGAHSLTVSGEGNRNTQFLTKFWAESAPDVDNWDFFPARQPSADVAEMAIKIGDHDVGFDKMWLVPSVNEERELIDIKIWHPVFEQMDENARYHLVFVMLDEALGEWGTQNWIGAIEFEPAADKEALPLSDLQAYIEELQTSTGWQKLSPLDAYHGYELRPTPEAEGFIRSDCFVGSTNNMMLIEEYYGMQGNMDNPLEGSGADFVFLRFPTEILPEGREIDARSEIEDHLSDSLQAARSGHSLGGAISPSYAYLDFIIFDGQNSIDLLLKEMKGLELPTGSSIHYFTRKNGQASFVL